MSQKAEVKSGERRRWPPAEKAGLVRRHLQEKVSLADLADETGIAPSQLGRWCKEGLEGLDSVFAQANKRERRAVAKEVASKEARIRQLQEVITELSEEVLRLKKANGAR